MNDDPSMNFVVFELSRGGKLTRLQGAGPTRANDCVSRIWYEMQRASYGVQDQMVRRIYSEWQPSRDDLVFLAHHFPQAQVTYSFARPREDQWEQALDEAHRQIRQAPLASSDDASSGKAVRARFSFSRLFPWWR